jgi:hypothetical protein
MAECMVSGVGGRLDCSVAIAINIEPPMRAEKQEKLDRMLPVCLLQGGGTAGRESIDMADLS